MTLSRRRLLHHLGAGAAAAFAAPPLLAARRHDNTGERASGGSPIRLNRNESAYGPSPRSAAAAREASTSSASRFPDEACEALRDAIARSHRVSAEQVIVGCGSTDILRKAADAFTGPQKRAVVALPTFGAMAAYARRSGAEVAQVPLTASHSHDTAAMLARCDSRAGLVYICNPNNPTGTLTRRSDLEALVQQLPAHTYIVIDEAYHDYVGGSSDYVSFIERPLDDPRVIVTRSFSKIHGLAGLRVGYAIAARQTAQLLDAQRLTDGVNAVGAMAATAALEDVEFVREMARRNADDRQEFFNQANARMLRWIDSVTNFAMLLVGRGAAQMVDHFQKNGILLPAPSAPKDEYVRVSLGTREEMGEFWRMWDHVMPSHAMSM
jgi:histidinol-phosphate aminotransferase